MSLEAFEDELRGHDLAQPSPDWGPRVMSAAQAELAKSRELGQIRRLFAGTVILAAIGVVTHHVLERSIERTIGLTPAKLAKAQGARDLTAVSVVYGMHIGWAWPEDIRRLLAPVFDPHSREPVRSSHGHPRIPESQSRATKGADRYV